MKQTVKILDNYKVEIDRWNHTLYKYDEGGEEIKVGKNRGNLSKPKWEEVGFYPNLKQCLNKILWEDSLQDKVETIDAYMDRLDSIADRLVKEVNV